MRDQYNNIDIENELQDIISNSRNLSSFQERVNRSSPNSVAFNASKKSREATRTINKVQSGHTTRKRQEHNGKTYGVDINKKKSIQRSKKNNKYRAKSNFSKRIKNFALAFGISAAAIVSGINIVNYGTTFKTYEKTLETLDDTEKLADELNLSHDTLLEYAALKESFNNYENYPEDITKDELKAKINQLQNVGYQAFYEKFKSDHEKAYPDEIVTYAKGKYNYALHEDAYFIEYKYEKDGVQEESRVHNPSTSTTNYISSQRTLNIFQEELYGSSPITDERKLEIIKEVNNQVLKDFDRRIIHNSEFYKTPILRESSEKDILPDL